MMGCSGGTGTVTGTVTYKGKPVPQGIVTFYSPDNRVILSHLQPDGSYAAEEIAVGEVKVSVEAPQGAPPAPAVPAPPGGPIDPRTQVKVTLLPRRYADPNTSGLTVKVTSGKQVFPIELSD